MTQAESLLSRKILNTLRSNGVFCFKVHGSEFMMAGLPDIIACVDGVFVGFEVKLPTKRNNLSARQMAVHKMIESASGKIYVICSVAEALKYVYDIRLKLREI